MEKSRNWLFDTWNGQKLPLQTGKIGQIFIENSDFQGHLSTFITENKPRIGPFKTKNSAKIIPKQP